MHAERLQQAFVRPLNHVVVKSKIHILPRFREGLQIRRWIPGEQHTSSFLEICYKGWDRLRHSVNAFYLYHNMALAAYTPFFLQPTAHMNRFRMADLHKPLVKIKRFRTKCGSTWSVHSRNWAMILGVTQRGCTHRNRCSSPICMHDSNPHHQFKYVHISTCTQS